MLWIFIASNITLPDETWVSGAQIGILFLFAIIGGWLAFKFVEQVLKAVTAFIGGFMFASGLAFFLSYIDGEHSRNVVDWVMFFGSYQNYTNLEDVCDHWCISCVALWLVCFVMGCIVQYKCHRRFKRKDNDDECDSDSEMTEYDYSPENVPTQNSKKAKRKKEKRPKTEQKNVEIHVGMSSEYGYPGTRMANHVPSQSSQPDGSMLATGIRPTAPSTVAMSEYGANYYSQSPQSLQPGMGHHSQYENYGQRNDVQYV